MRTRTIALALAAALPLALTACAENGSAPPAANNAAEKASQDNPAWLLAVAPEAARGVAEVKSSAKEGDPVVVRGRIGGVMEPIGDDSAFFVMMDPAVPSCLEMKDDACPTPWDYCCEPKDSLVANNATVMVVNSEGAPIEADLRSYGFEPLDEVIVVGAVAPRPTDAVLTIRASGLYRVPG